MASDGATCKQQENELDKLENKEQGKLQQNNNRNKESNNCIESEPHRTQIEARRQPTSSSSTPRRPGDIQNRRRQSLPQFGGKAKAVLGGRIGRAWPTWKLDEMSCASAILCTDLRHPPATHTNTPTHSHNICGSSKYDAEVCMTAIANGCRRGTRGTTSRLMMTEPKRVGRRRREMERRRKQGKRIEIRSLGSLYGRMRFKFRVVVVVESCKKSGLLNHARCKFWHRVQRCTKLDKRIKWQQCHTAHTARGRERARERQRQTEW